METIKGVTEETAQELIKVFEEYNESCKDFEKAFEGTVKVYINNCELAAAGKVIAYAEKYANATFLTKWYWLRKLRKVNEALLGLCQFDEEYFKQKNA